MRLDACALRPGFCSRSAANPCLSRRSHFAKGDLKAVDAAARSLEAEKVDLIYSVATSVSLAVKRATKSVPIVFYAGTDPAAFGLVESFRKPGGRLTGVHGQFTDLAAKRLQLLKEMIPTLRRVVTFYSPDNPAARESMKIGRDAARQLKVELLERPVASVEELRAGLLALRPGEADAIFYVADAMVTSQSEMVIDIAVSKKLPTMYAVQGKRRQGSACQLWGQLLRVRANRSQERPPYSPGR